jgi:hypothetical protein
VERIKVSKKPSWILGLEYVFHAVTISEETGSETRQPTGDLRIGGGDNLIILAYPDILDDLGDDPR